MRMNFIASAIGWNKPAGPTRFGPRRSWISALTRRAARDSDGVVATYDELTGFGPEGLAGGKTVIEFGSRRAHGPDAAVHAARAAYIAGCAATSNVAAGGPPGNAVRRPLAPPGGTGIAARLGALRPALGFRGARAPCGGAPPPSAGPGPPARLGHAADVGGHRGAAIVAFQQNVGMVRIDPDHVVVSMRHVELGEVLAGVVRNP